MPSMRASIINDASLLCSFLDSTTKPSSSTRQSSQHQAYNPILHDTPESYQSIDPTPLRKAKDKSNKKREIERPDPKKKKKKMPPLKVLISGGGIAGNALAFWLAKIGHDITVVERFSSLRDTGLQLDLRGHGVEVMRRTGLQEAFKAQVAPEKGLQLVDKKGRRRAFFPAVAPSEAGAVQNFTSEFEIMRGTMCRILHDAAVKRGARFVFGNSVEKMDVEGGEAGKKGVEVRFADGKTDTYDLGEF